MTLKDGHYTPASNDVHVRVWPTITDSDEDSPTFGEEIGDEDNLPEGFDVRTESAGRKYYVHLTNGKPTRHPVTKEAVNLVPGGAVLTYANGIVKTMTPREFKAFEAAHVTKDAELPANADDGGDQ